MTPSTAYATCIRARGLGTPDAVLKRFVVMLQDEGLMDHVEAQSIIDRLGVREA